MQRSEAVRASRRDEASPWVVRFAPLVDPAGAVLDVASGRGRHARWFESLGHRVTAIDRDADALAASGATERIRCDLESDADPRVVWPVAGRAFAAVVVTNYLHRPLLPLLADALVPGGVLLYETFAAGQAAYGRPSDPAYLLAPGELLSAFAQLAIVAYEDGLRTEPTPASVQRLCACRPRAPDGAPQRHVLSPGATAHGPRAP